MQYTEYVEQKKESGVILGIDEEDAKKVLKFLPKKERFTHYFWSVGWLFVIPIGIFMTLFVVWWLGFLILLCTPPLFFKATKVSVANPVLKYADGNERFFNLLVQKNVLSFKRVGE